MSSIPDQLNILNNEFATVNTGLKLGSNVAKQSKFYEKGIIPIEDEEGSENVMRKQKYLSWTDKLDFVKLSSYSSFFKRKGQLFMQKKKQNQRLVVLTP